MQKDPVTESWSWLEFLVDYFKSSSGGFIIPIVGLVSFVLVIVLIYRAKNAYSSPAMALLIPLPIAMTFAGALQGIIRMLTIMTLSRTVPKTADLADGLAQFCAGRVFGVVAMLPAFVLALLWTLRKYVFTSNTPRS